MSTFGNLFPEAEVRKQRRFPRQVSAESESLAARAQVALARSSQLLLSLQKPEGYWSGELTADSTLESDYVLLQLWLHQPDSRGWNPTTRLRIDKACRAVLDRQLPDGGWNIYAGGPSEISASVKAYSALKIAGYQASHPAMQRACHTILKLGGVQAANSYTKINLSLFGLYPRRYVPSVPPEIVLLPGDVLYQMSSWSRAILVPLSIVQTAGPERLAPAGVTLEEIFLPDVKLRMPSRERLSVFFLHLDRVIKLWERRGLKDVRSAALREAEHWILDRTRYTEGLGAIYPAMMYTVMAFDSLGYADDHPDLMEAIRQFDNLLVETPDRFQFHPCYSPVWDTAISAFALGEAGVMSSAELTRAADWLLTKEIRRKGDWSVKRPNLEPGGWAFEFANEYYPDIDDTAMVLQAFLHAKASDPDKQIRATRRAIHWIIGMQGSDGGWAAFDVDNNWQILNKIPFADHNAMLDPSCPDITGSGGSGAPWPRTVRPGSSGRRALSAGRAGGRWKLARPLGRELRLWNIPGAPWFTRREGGRRRAFHSAGRAVDSLHSERRRRLGRELRQLRCQPLRRRTQHRLANCLGFARIARCRGHHLDRRAPRSRVAALPSVAQRRLGRGADDRYRLPASLLPAVPPLPPLLSGARSGGVRSRRVRGVTALPHPAARWSRILS